MKLSGTFPESLAWQVSFSNRLDLDGRMIPQIQVLSLYRPLIKLSDGNGSQLTGVYSCFSFVYNGALLHGSELV